MAQAGGGGGPGTLNVTVEAAKGKGVGWPQAGEPVFCRAEVRAKGGGPGDRRRTASKPVELVKAGEQGGGAGAGAGSITGGIATTASKHVISWGSTGETLSFSLSSDSDELRLVLCAEDESQGPRGRTLANGGFFVKDIIGLKSVDHEWFDMFAPNGAGGSIRLSLRFFPSGAATTGHEPLFPNNNPHEPISPKANTKISTPIDQPDLQGWRFEL